MRVVAWPACIMASSAAIAAIHQALTSGDDDVRESAFAALPEALALSAGSRHPPAPSSEDALCVSWQVVVETLVALACDEDCDTSQGALEGLVAVAGTLPGLLHGCIRKAASPPFAAVVVNCLRRTRCACTDATHRPVGTRACCQLRVAATAADLVSVLGWEPSAGLAFVEAGCVVPLMWLRQCDGSVPATGTEGADEDSSDDECASAVDSGDAALQTLFGCAAAAAKAFQSAPSGTPPTVPLSAKPHPSTSPPGSSVAPVGLLQLLQMLCAGRLPNWHVKWCEGSGLNPAGVCVVEWPTPSRSHETHRGVFLGLCGFAGFFESEILLATTPSATGCDAAAPPNGYGRVLAAVAIQAADACRSSRCGSRQRQDNPGVLVLGLGAGTVPAYVARMRSGCVVHAVEIDPAMERVARLWFGIRDIPNLHTYVGDGIAIVAGVARPAGTCAGAGAGAGAGDVRAASHAHTTGSKLSGLVAVIVDVYSMDEFPEAAASQRFVDGVAWLLQQGTGRDGAGIAAFNIGRRCPLLPAVMAALSKSFKHCSQVCTATWLAANGCGGDSDSREDNVVLVGSQQPVLLPGVLKADKAPNTD